MVVSSTRGILVLSAKRLTAFYCQVKRQSWDLNLGLSAECGASAFKPLHQLCLSPISSSRLLVTFSGYTHTGAGTRVFSTGEMLARLARLRRLLWGTNSISYRPARASRGASGCPMQILTCTRWMHERGRAARPLGAR